ncbi:alkene reductase [Methylobacter sp. YRD-M1]|uniref:alkene reductase n=1 Tax=Methylobacter sp. YRD-M1 TaxID=2911520 RepID=UPI00227C6965|nr:alkene reductase [Methylobacter sp. YRD-M1]WAK02445.1 alkene reductase [Methylobacter sp. YRD-M1]
MSDALAVLSPVKLGPYKLPNRLAMAPLTRCRASSDGIPNALMVEYYRQRASAGLIISEATPVSPQGKGYPYTPGIYNDAQIQGWQAITSAVHEKGGRIFLQLWHVGRISHPSLQPDGALPVAPSALKPAGQASTEQGPQDFVTPRALELAEIPGIVEQFRHGADCALKAGFDGVEIHGANGYLLDQFLRDGTNRRTDAYGGSIANRARLLFEVIEAVSSVWGSDKVGVRLSPLQPFNDISDSDPRATFSYVVEQLNRFNLAYLHITEMGKEAPGAAGSAFDLEELRTLYHGIYMLNAGYTAETATAAIAEGRADLIAFGKLFIANPDLPERFAKNAPLNEPDFDTFYQGGAHGYTDYPFLAD